MQRRGLISFEKYDEVVREWIGRLQTRADAFAHHFHVVAVSNVAGLVKCAPFL
jgi:hypothetical protein